MTTALRSVYEIHHIDATNELAAIDQRTKDQTKVDKVDFLAVRNYCNDLKQMLEATGKRAHFPLF